MLYVNEGLTEPYTWLWPCILPVRTNVLRQHQSQPTPAPHQGKTHGRWASPRLWRGREETKRCEPNTVCYASFLQALWPGWNSTFKLSCFQQVFMICETMRSGKSEYNIILWARKSLCNWFNIRIGWKKLIVVNENNFKLPVKLKKNIKEEITA